MSDQQETFTPIAHVGEFGLIDRLHAVLPVPSADVVVGIGDDAAVYRTGEGRLQVVTTDMLIEGVHFDRTYVPLGHLGSKCVSVNVSDVVAMNATPRFALVSLGLPNNISVEQAETLYAGIAEASRRYEVSVIGGDTSAAERLVISVSLIGQVEPDLLVTRGGARPGDMICVTGDLGASAAGLKVMMSEKEAFLAEDRQPDLAGWAHVVARHLAPLARLDITRAWREAGFKPSSLIDISDGLASEVHHLCRASGTGAALEGGYLPMHVETFRAAERFGDRPETYALFGGEDYELLFTADPETLRSIPEDSYAVVGEMTDFLGDVTLRLDDGQAVPLDPQGFRHF